MKGLLYKDFASTKKETRLCLGVCALFLLFAVAVDSQGESVFSLGPTVGVLVAFGSMAPTYSLQYDKTSGWNRFICASPISRDKVVLSKYVYGVIDAAVFTLIVVLANVLTGNHLPFWAIGCIILVILVIQAVMLPVCLKLGQNAVVVVFLLLVFVPVGTGLILHQLGILTDTFLEAATAAFASASPLLLGALLLILTALLYTISYCVSCRFFRKMEF